MGNPVLDTLIPVIITLLAPFVTQLLKGTKVTGGAALVLTFVVCTVAAALAAFVSGAINLPAWTGDPVAFLQALGTLVSVVFTVAQVIYHGIIKPTGVGMTEGQRQLENRKRALDRQIVGAE